LEEYVSTIFRMREPSALKKEVVGSFETLINVKKLMRHHIADVTTLGTCRFKILILKYSVASVRQAPFPLSKNPIGQFATVWEAKT